MNERIEREILAAHADQLNAGLKGTAAYPHITLDQLRAIEPLLQFTERLYRVFVPVEPSPIFV